MSNTVTAEKILDSIKAAIAPFSERIWLSSQRSLLLKNAGIFAVEDSVASAEIALDVYEDLIKVSHYSSLCGGTKALSPDQTAFIDKWEVENYRRKISQSSGQDNKLNNKTAIVTGGAQGFGAGIAEALFRLKVNVVVADLNEETGSKFVSGLQIPGSRNKAVFVRTDVC